MTSPMLMHGGSLRESSLAFGPGLRRVPSALARRQNSLPYFTAQAGASSGFLRISKSSLAAVLVNARVGSGLAIASLSGRPAVVKFGVVPSVRWTPDWQ